VKFISISTLNFCPGFEVTLLPHFLVVFIINCVLVTK